MYGQGNHSVRYGQGHDRPSQSLQQYPSVPPPPPSQFQQGPSDLPPPPPSVIQQAGQFRSVLSDTSGYLNTPQLQPPMRTQFPPGALATRGQSFGNFHSVHGGGQMMRPYPVPQLNSYHPSFLATSSTFIPGPLQSIAPRAPGVSPVSSMALNPPLPASSPPAAPPPPIQSLPHDQTRAGVQVQNGSSKERENDGLTTEGVQWQSSPTYVEVQPSVKPDAVTDVGASDSDVDMDLEDPDKDPQIQISGDGPKKSTYTADEYVMPNQENSLPDSTLVNASVPTPSVAGDGKNSSEQLVDSGSPFRQIGNYEDNFCSKEVSSTAASRMNKDETTTLCDNIESRSQEAHEVSISPCGTASSHHVLGTTVPNEAKKAVPISRTAITTTGRSEKLVGSSSGRETSVNDDSSNLNPIHGKDSSRRDPVDDKKSAPSHLKVDEFGRRIRDHISESESDTDGSYYSRRRGRGRRSRSRSQSPPDRTRRRSPRRRIERRSRSRSWSPRRQRSRSRSPYRYAGVYGSEKPRRGKCFDFLKGRCRRGGSCRYLHHELGNRDGSGHYKSSQQHIEVAAGSRYNVAHHEWEELGSRSLSDGGDLKNNASQPNQTREGNNISTFKNQEPSKYHTAEGRSIGQLVKEVVIDKSNFGSSTDVNTLPQTSEPRDSLGTSISKSNEKYPDPGMPSNVIPELQHPQPLQPTLELHGDHNQPHELAVNTVASSVMHATSLHQIPVLPRPPPLHTLRPLVDYGSMNSTMNFPHRSTSTQGDLPYQISFSNQQVHYSFQGNPPWIGPPPPPMHRPCSVNSRLACVPSNVLQGSYPVRDDLPGQASLRANGHEPPRHFQIGGLQNQVHSSSVRPLRPTAMFKSTLENPYFSWQQPQQYASDGTSAVVAGGSSDIGASTISARYNQYASTFDQPHSSSLKQDEGKFDSSSSGGQVQTEGQNAGSAGLDRAIMSPKSSGASGNAWPGSGIGQYNPLSDSLEPSSESLKKHAIQQYQATDNSDMLDLSGSHKLMDVEGSSKNKDAGAVTTSVDNDELGETVDAEVGVVEDGSPSDSNDGGEAVAGEIDIDQDEATNKKSKDSRSIKLFRAEVANFVKEVLKPSWREGNMSKEAFKTIVKKTVDKVSGAMKAHRVPKSKAKIDQYIGSSHRKLSKLVEGYVNKYAKP